jgi:hypothetical protein
MAANLVCPEARPARNGDHSGDHVAGSLRHHGSACRRKIAMHLLRRLTGASFAGIPFRGGTNAALAHRHLESDP